MSDNKNRQPHQGLKAIAVIKVLRGSIAITIGVLLIKWQSIAAVKQTILPELKDSSLLQLIDYLEIDERLLFLIGLIITTIGLIRYAEAIGLWFEKRWAEWLAFITSMIYIPFLSFSLYLEFRMYVMAALCINLLICIYLYRIIRQP
jgi:uncharacterized membrane protein (DUF2068 family)